MSSIGDKDWSLKDRDQADQTTAPAGTVRVEVSNDSNSEHCVDVFVNSDQVSSISKGTSTVQDCGSGDAISVRNSKFSSGKSSGKFAFTVIV